MAETKEQMEKTIAEQGKIIAEHVKTIAEQGKIIAEHVKTIAAMEEINAAQTAAFDDEKAAHGRTTESSLKIVEELTLKLEGMKNTSSGTAEKLTVKSGGKNYQLMYPSIRLNDTDYTQAEIASDEELVSQLVEMGSGMVQEII